MVGRYLEDFQRKYLEESLQQADLHPKYRTRIKIMLFCDAGLSQAEICKQLHCSRETARHWITIAEMGQAHQWRSYPLGRPRSANQIYLDRLKELVKQSPREHGYSFRQWTAKFLSQHLEEELGIKLSSRQINRLLRQMGLSTRKTASHGKPESTVIVIQDLSSY